MTDMVRLDLVERGRVLVVALTGEIDLSNAEELEAAIVVHLLATPRALVVDLTGITFLDSAGVRLMDHLVAAEPAGGPLVVAPPGGRVRFTLRLCHFPEELLREDVDAAVAELTEASDR